MHEGSVVVLGLRLLLLSCTATLLRRLLQAPCGGTRSMLCCWPGHASVIVSMLQQGEG
jgi:uncharacterized membrane protein AbrB (regulator of aidB expression)